MIEIERKFLVTSSDFITESQAHHQIAQGYLNSNPERTVRVRIKDNQGFLTIKGKSNESGTTRFEWEKEIPIAEAKQLIVLCEKGVIEKTRYLIKKEKHLFEVDVFSGENEGLVIAEIELADENEPFVKPHWLGDEVTHEERYYNAYLSQFPYKSW